jgi:hypothetical protein
MKKSKWIMAVIIFFIISFLSAFLLQLCLSWVMSLGGWKWIVLIFWFFLVLFAAGMTIAIPSWLSPDPFLLVVIIRWVTIISLVISLIITGFEFNLLAKSNLIYSLIVVYFASEKHLKIFLKGV